MKKFPFLRRPLRQILYSLLLALLSAAALIFTWQYKLDGIILDHAIDSYAYVGTVVREGSEITRDNQDGGLAYLEPIPEGLVEWLTNCELVSRVDSRRTLAANIGEYTQVHRDITAQTATISDTSMSAKAGAQPFHFLEGTIMSSECWSEPEEEIQYDEYRIRVNRMWSDPSYVYDMMIVDYDRMKDEPQFQEGQRVFVIGYQITSGNTGEVMMTQSMIHSPKAHEYIFDGYDVVLTLPLQHPITLIPEDADSTEFIESFLASTGLDEVLEEQMTGKFSVTVRQTRDMMMIRNVAKGLIKTYEGRMLTPEDAGKKVCVISSAISQRNRLSVGDTIRLSIGDGCYTIPQGCSASPICDNPGGCTNPMGHLIGGWESAAQNEGDEPLNYGEYEEYEIVGIYSQKGRKEGNTLYFTANDIFIPAEENTVAETPRPYSFSFRVPGPDYVDFREMAEPVMDEYGYLLMVDDSGWDDVKENFYSMQTRRKLSLLCAAAAFAAAVVVISLLLNTHCRYEYGLRRLMGATKREATGIYCSVFFFTAIPGMLLALGGAGMAAVRLIGQALAENALTPLPTNAQCALTLSLWGLAELAAILLALLALTAYNERRGLLRLVRR